MKNLLVILSAFIVASGMVLTLSANINAGPLSSMHSDTWLEHVVNRMDTIKFHKAPGGTVLITSLPGSEFILTKMYLDYGTNRWLEVRGNNGSGGLLTYIRPDEHTGGGKKRHSDELMILNEGESIVVGGNGLVTGYLTGFWVHR